jgi:hypothetical protein
MTIFSSYGNSGSYGNFGNPLVLTFVTFSFATVTAKIRPMALSQVISDQRPPAVSSRVQFLEYFGKKVLFINYANCDAAMMKEVAGEGHRVLALEPLNSVLTLNDVTGATFDQEAVAFLKSMVAANAPYVRRGAVIGISGLQSLIYEAVQAFSKRKLPQFSNREQALSWLVKD